MNLGRGLGVIALVAILAGGCGGAPEVPSSQPSESASRPAPSGLREALARVRANDTTRGYLEYIDSTALNALFSGQDPYRFIPIENVGLGGLARNARILGRNVGVDPAQTRTRLVAGRGSDSAGMLFGSYDMSKVNTWFERNGGVREDAGTGTRWRTGTDKRAPTDDRVERLVADGSFNVVQTGPDWFAWSHAGDSLAWFVEPGDATLATDETMTSLADCLGDATFAVIERMPSGVTYAAGMQVGQGTEVTEMICARPPSASQVTAMVDKANRLLRDHPHLTFTAEQAGEAARMTLRNQHWPTGNSLNLIRDRRVVEYFEG